MSKQKKIPAFLRGVLTDEDMRRIAETIAQLELNTSGEIRVSIHEKRRFRERKKDLGAMALAEFRRLGMHRTREGTGILLYILFRERKLQILADAGIYAKIPQDVWDGIAEGISQRFREGHFLEGIRHGLTECGALLAREFPVRPDDVNELPNDVSIS